MKDEDFHLLLRETSDVAASSKEGLDAADGVLMKLQEAVKDHEKILHQQELLIRQLRDQLRGVNSDRA